MSAEPEARGSRRGRLRRVWVAAATLVVAAIALWWAVGRVTADGRRLAVRHLDSAATGMSAAPDSTTAGGPGGTTVRILAWNIAHGRGDDSGGWLGNWTGGSVEARGERLRRMAAVLRRSAADVVVLNEVDFDAAWSGGVDQARVLAEAAGYPVWVEQRNFDVHLPFASFVFGNAVLSRLPVVSARWLELPARARLEAVLAGVKAAAAVRVATAAGPVTVVPVHLEFRPGPTRLAAVPVFDSLRAAEEAPVVLAGDFNAAPPDWPETPGATVLGELLELGWRSPRAEATPAEVERTWPAPDPRRGLDWILVEPPLEVLETRVLRPGDGLSDHAPVLSVIRLPHPASPGRPPSSTPPG